MNAPRLSVKEHYLLSLWDDYLRQPKLHQLDRYLAQAMRRIRSAGKQDRLWYGDHLFAMARYSTLTLFLAAHAHEKRMSPERLQELIETMPAPRDSEEMHEQLREIEPLTLWAWTRARLEAPTSPESFHPVLQALQALANHHTGARLLWNGMHPYWHTALELRASRSQWTSTELHTFIDAHASRPPIYLRVKSDHREQVELDLRVNALAFTHLPVGKGEDASRDAAFSISGSKGLYELDSYKDGHFEIQDFASQCIGHAVKACAGELGWDACAGGGGKSLQLGSAMQGRGAIYASDIRQHKLEELKKRAKRAQLHNIRTFTWQGDPLDRLPRDVARKGGFDFVLVDAPCTSSGTWRRNPDARWRCDNPTIDTMTTLQTKLLDAAAQSVRPGGRLVYSTCSFLVAENENIVGAFLITHPDFELTAQQLHGNPAMDADTMFSAVLTKKAAGSDHA